MVHPLAKKKKCKINLLCCSIQFIKDVTRVELGHILVLEARKKERKRGKKKKAHQHKQVLLICASLIWIVRPEKKNNWIENTRCNVYSWDELFRKLLSIKVKRNRTTNEGYISS